MTSNRILGRVRMIGTALAATLVLQVAATGLVAANHDGVTAEVTIYRGDTVVNGYMETVIAPGNETIYVNLWNLGNRDYNRIVRCWSAAAKVVVIPAGQFNVLEQCPMGGSWRIQTFAGFSGLALPQHDKPVLVWISIHAGPYPG